MTTNVVCCSGQGFNYNGSDGVNSYKALNIKIDQRAANGLTLTAFYTYSRAIDQGGNDGVYQPDLRVNSPDVAITTATASSF